MQQDMLAMMAQMRDAVAYAAQAAQTSSQALQEFRSSMATTEQSSGLKGADLSRILSRPDRFAAANREEELSSWRSWSWTVEQYLAALDPGFSSDLEAMRANREAELLIADMEASTRVRSHQLYAILSSILNDRCKAVLRSIGQNNGYEAWRVLENDMAPASRARHLAILNAIAYV